MEEKLKITILDKQPDLLYTTMAEECSELIKASTKIYRRIYHNQDILETEFDNMFEEMCDVEINLELMKDNLVKYSNYTREEIDSKINVWKGKKLEKLRKVFLGE